MPYIVHPRTVEPESLVGDPEHEYASPQAAGPACKARGKDHVVTFVESEAESRTWRTRERNRFRDGTYLGLPWDQYVYWGNEPDPYPDHFPHISVDNPTQIAYTKSPEHGIRDRQTIVRCAKYFQDFPGYARYLLPHYIAQISTDLASTTTELKIARTADEIEAVYLCGPNSCMSHHLDEYESDIHPVRVYGDSDLGVAYLGDLDAEKVTARAIVWPDKMIHSRSYGHSKLMNLVLKRAGYTNVYDGPDRRMERFDGARIRYAESGSGIVVPYLDGITAAYVAQPWIVFGDGGRNTVAVPTDYTTGLCLSKRSDDTDDGDYFHCDRCNDRTHVDNGIHDAVQVGDGSYCNDCLDARSHCDACGYVYWGDSYAPIDPVDDHRSVCGACLEAHYTRTCAHPDCGEQWIEERRFTLHERDRRGQADTHNLCFAHAETHYECQHCAHVCEKDAMCCAACGMAPYCHATEDLFSFAVLGVNYYHAREANLTVPTNPDVFTESVF